jgi:hypothetical protein
MICYSIIRCRFSISVNSVAGPHEFMKEREKRLPVNPAL